MLSLSKEQTSLFAMKMTGQEFISRKKSFLFFAVSFAFVSFCMKYEEEEEEEEEEEKEGGEEE